MNKIKIMLTPDHTRCLNFSSLFSSSCFRVKYTFILAETLGNEEVNFMYYSILFINCKISVKELEFFRGKIGIVFVKIQLLL